MSLVSVNYCLWFSDKLLDHIKLKNNAEILSMLEDTNSHQLTDSSGTTLLHHAAKYGNDEFARHLIDLGAEVDAQNRTKETPLMLAVDYDREEIVRLLLKVNADIFKPDFSGQCALGKAFSNRHNISKNVMAALLDGVTVESLNSSAYVKNPVFHVGCPLYYFMSLKNAEVTRILLENGSQVDARKPYSGETALHVAVANLDVKNVKLLLEFNADVNAKRSDSKTPLACIPRFDDENLRDVLAILELFVAAGVKTIDHDDYVILVETLLTYGSAEVVCRVLQCEIDVNFIDRKGKTALMYLADNVHSNIFEELRDIKFDLGDHGLRPAIVEGNVNLVQFLLERGVEVGARDILSFGIFMTLDSIITGMDVVSDFKKRMSMCTETVLAHLAMIEVSGRQIEEHMQHQIKLQQQYKSIFDSKKLQLEEIKQITIGNSITLLDILMADDDRKISMFACNKRLVSSLADAMKKCDIDSYYHYRLRIRFAKINQLAEKREKVTNTIDEVLSEMFNLSVHIVAEKLVNYLDDGDLNKILP